MLHQYIYIYIDASKICAVCGLATHRLACTSTRYPLHVLFCVCCLDRSYIYIYICIYIYTSLYIYTYIYGHDI